MSNLTVFEHGCSRALSGREAHTRKARRIERYWQHMPKRKPTYDKNKKMSTLCKIFAFLLCFAVTVAHISFKNEENFDDIHFLTSSTDKQLPWSEGTLRSRLKKRSTTGGGDKPKLSVYSFSDANHNQAVLHWSGVPGSEVKLLLYTLICGTSVVKIRM